MKNSHVVAPLMNLSVDLLAAIKNQTYSLRPVKISKKKRRQSSPAEDYNIAQILARRIAMGYGGTEEDNISVKSDDSCGSCGSINSHRSVESIKSVGSTK